MEGEQKQQQYKIEDGGVAYVTSKKEEVKHEKNPRKNLRQSKSRMKGRKTYYAKFINTNMRTLNEPISYMEPDKGPEQQSDWWLYAEAQKRVSPPPYDTKSTQRSDFQTPTCPLVLPVKYYKMRKPTCGIVPLTYLDASGKPESNYMEYISFIHQYDSRKTPNEPIRGKRHGTFVLKEIKPGSGPVDPEGVQALPNAPGSCSPEHCKKTERGNPEGGTGTSSCLCPHNSQESLET